MRTLRISPRLPIWRACATIVSVAATTFLLSGCDSAPLGTDSPAPASFDGTLAGSVAQTRSTRESLDTADGSAQQLLPPDIDPSRVNVTFEDLSGQPLLDASGNPIANGSIAGDGTFEIDNLPVGIDFVVAIDLDGDGETDIEQVVQIPVDATGVAGRIENVMVDPLTTLATKMFLLLLEEKGIDPNDIDFSPTALVNRIVDAYTHFFEESGIEQEVTVEDLADLTAQNVRDFFDELIPPTVRAGMDTVQGNLALGVASDVEDVVLGAAEVFLRAGFPVADDYGGVDLSYLGDLPDVEIKTFDMIFGKDDRVEAAQLDLGNLTQEEIDTMIADGLLDAFDGGTLPETVVDGEPPPQGFEPTIYVSRVVEPDRNFAAFEEEEGGGSTLPFISEHLLIRMAKLHLEGRTITLRSLYRVLTDTEVGLGARLSYWAPPPPGREGPPLTIFESADGQGVARDVDGVVFEMMQSGVFDPSTDFDSLEAQTAYIRGKMQELLAGTVPPSVQRLFGAILSERIESAEQIFGFIRKAQAHLPFNLSGPSNHYVVADGDPYRPDAGAVNAISVNVEFGSDGLPTQVTYDPTHMGSYYLGFTNETERSFGVELMVRETGRVLHGPHGERLMLYMDDASVFGNIDGGPFVDAAKEAGVFWPGVSVSVADPGYRIGDSTDDSSGGPDMQLFVLATMPGPEGQPVRVDFDLATSDFTHNPDGRYYMMFTEDSHLSGVFGLYDIQMNFMASVTDLSADLFVDDQVFYPDDPMLPPMEPTTMVDDPMLPPMDPTTTVDDPMLPPADPTTTVDDPAAPQELPSTNDPLLADGTVTTGDGPLPPPDEPLPPPQEFMWEPVLIAPADVVGLTIEPQFFTYIYGTEVPNENYEASKDPFFDDANGNGVQDPGELTADFRPMLFNGDDWRATDIARYYRRESGGAVIMDEVDFESRDPRASDGEALVARHYLPRLNAFRFGRPNTAINLLTTFLPADFFDGTHALTEESNLNIFQAISMINLVMDQMFNVEAIMDFDGDGPFQAQRMMIDAHLFVLPLGDPFVLILEGFETLSVPPARR